MASCPAPRGTTSGSVRLNCIASGPAMLPVNRDYSTALDRYSRRGERRQTADDGRRRGPSHGDTTMEKQHTLKILNGLANGINPATGERFNADSPYQHPDIVRA